MVAWEHPDVALIKLIDQLAGTPGALAIDGDTAPAHALMQISRVSPNVLLNQGLGVVQNVLEVRLLRHLVFEGLFELLVLHLVANFLQKLNDSSQVDVLRHSLHEELVADKQEFLEVGPLLRDLLTVIARVFAFSLV